MPIPTLSQWLSRTSTTMSIRGDRLKAVDNAIRDWNLSKTPENLEKINAKLTVYIAAKGAAWRDNDRNAKHAISNLYEELQVQLFGADPVAMSLAELRSITNWRAAQKEAAKRLFTGTRLVTKTDSETRKLTGGLSAGEVIYTARNVEVGAEDIGKATGLIRTVVQKAVEPAYVAEVLEFLHASGAFKAFVAEAAKAIIPFSGVITSGGKAIQNLIQAAIDEYKKSEVEDHEHILVAGDPTAAMAAVSRIIDREQTKHLATAAMAAAQAGTQAILTVLDVSGASQAVVGAAAALASLTQRVFYIGRDFSEKNKANTALADPAGIDLKIFETHPILGCYLLVCSETSSLITFLAGFGGIGWMDDVEEAVKEHLAPLQSIAVDYINDSRFDLVNTDGSRLEQRLYVNPGLMAKAKKLKDGGWSVTSAGRWATLTPEQYKEKFGGELPADFRERIEGRDRFSDARDALARRKADVWDRFNNVKPKLRRR